MQWQKVVQLIAKKVSPTGLHFHVYTIVLSKSTHLPKSAHAPHFAATPT